MKTFCALGQARQIAGQIEHPTALGRFAEASRTGKRIPAAAGIAKAVRPPSRPVKWVAAGIDSLRRAGPLLNKRSQQSRFWADKCERLERIRTAGRLAT